MVKRLVRQDMNSNNLFLLENLAHILEKCMREVSELPSVRIHRVKDDGFVEKRRAEAVKKMLLDNNQRYETYLLKFNEQCWGFLPDREKYVLPFSFRSKN